MIEVGFAELHDAIFVGGKNLSAKLDTHRYPALHMVYDKAEKELIVTWQKVTAYVPSTNIKSYIPGRAPDRKIVQMGSPQVLNVSSTAQVETPGMLPISRVVPTAQAETPTGHVHAGPGNGKKGIGGKK